MSDVNQKNEILSVREILEDIANNKSTDIGGLKKMRAVEQLKLDSLPDEIKKKIRNLKIGKTVAFAVGLTGVVGAFFSFLSNMPGADASEEMLKSFLDNGGIGLALKRTLPYAIGGFAGGIGSVLSGQSVNDLDDYAEEKIHKLSAEIKRQSSRKRSVVEYLKDEVSGYERDALAYEIKNPTKFKEIIIHSDIGISELLGVVYCNSDNLDAIHSLVEKHNSVRLNEGDSDKNLINQCNADISSLVNSSVTFANTRYEKLTREARAIKAMEERKRQERLVNSRFSGRNRRDRSKQKGPNRGEFKPEDLFTDGQRNRYPINTINPVNFVPRSASAFEHPLTLKSSAPTIWSDSSKINITGSNPSLNGRQAKDKLDLVDITGSNPLTDATRGNSNIQYENITGQSLIGNSSIIANDEEIRSKAEADFLNTFKQAPSADAPSYKRR